MSGRFDPQAYWTRRLEQSYDLRGVGHHSYDVRYNRWLYRRKQDVLSASLRSVPQPFRALDVGSGTGWVVAALHRAGADVVTGVDITETAVHGLRERFPGDTFERCDVGVDRLPAGPFDVVTALDVLYHVVDDARWERALVDAAAVLAPSGVLLVSDGLGDADRAPAEHVRFRGRRRYEDAARAAGLRVASVGSYFSWLSRDRQDSSWSRRLGAAEGPVLYALERAAPRRPHMGFAVLVHDHVDEEHAA